MDVELQLMKVDMPVISQRTTKHTSIQVFSILLQMELAKSYPAYTSA